MYADAMEVLIIVCDFLRWKLQLGINKMFRRNYRNLQNLLVIVQCATGLVNKISNVSCKNVIIVFMVKNFWTKKCLHCMAGWIFTKKEIKVNKNLADKTLLIGRQSPTFYCLIYIFRGQ